MDTKRKGIFLAITGAVMWGIMGVFVRGLSAESFSSYEISFVRCLLAGVVFLLIKSIKQPSILKIDFKGLIICIVYGIVAYAASFTFYGISVERIPVAVSTVLMFMSPIWVALLGAIVFKEKLTLQTVVTIVICIFGAMLVANLIGASSSQMDIIGVLAGLANGFGVALQIMIPRYFAEKYERDTMLIYGFLGAAIALSLVVDFSFIASKVVSGNMKLIFDLFGVGILCTMVANVCFVKSTLYIDTTTCSILSALEVVVGAIVGIIIFKEAMTGLQVIGAIIVVLGSLGPTVLSYAQGGLSYMPPVLLKLVHFKGKSTSEKE